MIVVQQIIAQVGAVVEQRAPRQPRFIQPLQNAEIMDGHAYASINQSINQSINHVFLEWSK